jgi:hypothetical protein
MPDATGPDGGPDSANGSTSSSREDKARIASQLPREGAETDGASGSDGVGGFGPRPHSNVRSLLRLSFASCTVHTSQKYHRTTWMSISQSERLGA